MKVNELRIGNWIYDNDRLLSVVTGFKPFDDLETCDEDEGCYVLYRFYTTEDKMMWGEFKIDSNDCKPIPLTEETLLKCGFINHEPKDWGSFSLGNINFLLEDGNKMNGLYMNGYRVADVRYLHQLQNLYFAITGEELRVEL